MLWSNHHRGVAWVAGLWLLVAVLPAIGRSEPARVSDRHPRLFLTAEDADVGRGITVPVARARRTHPALEPYGRLTGSDDNWEGLLTTALRAVLGGDLEARDLATAWLMHQTEPSRHSTARQGPGHMAVAFDWLYNTLTPDERQTIAANITLGAQAALAFRGAGEPDINHNFTHMALFSVAMAGLALHDESEFEAPAAEFLRESNDWLEGPGGV